MSRAPPLRLASTGKVDLSQGPTKTDQSPELEFICSLEDYPRSPLERIYPFSYLCRGDFLLAISLLL